MRRCWGSDENDRLHSKLERGAKEMERKEKKKLVCDYFFFFLSE